MQLDTALTSAYSDTIYLFICFLIFLWLFKAIRRFYRTILLRQAYNSESIVQISGLGSYLSYFDGATTAHLHSIVHTRQTKPPVDMSMMLVPCSLVKSTISTDGERSVLELQINVLVPGKVILMSNFNMRKFRVAAASEASRKRAHSNHHHNSNSGGISFRDSLFSLDQQSISTLSDTRKYSLSTLAELEVCDRTCVKYDCNTGIQTIQFTFIIPKAANGLLPTGTAGGAAGERKSDSKRRDSNTPVAAPTPSESANATNTPPVRTGNEVFTIGIAFLPNSTDYSPRLRHNSGDLIRDRESVDRGSRSASRDSPGKNTPIFERQDVGSKEPSTGIFNGGFMNFRSYFSIGTSESQSRSLSGSKGLVAPIEAETPGNQYTDHSGDTSSSRNRLSMSQIAAQTNRKSEVTAVSIFTFQFPVNISSLFQDAPTSQPADSSDSTNPVIERSSSTSPTNQRKSSKSVNRLVPSATRTKEVLPKALTLMDKNGRIFNSLEIFGLASLNEGGSNVTVGSPMDTNALDDPTDEKQAVVKGPESTMKSRSNDSEFSFRPNSVKPTASTDGDLEAGRNTDNSNTGADPAATEAASVPITPSTSAIFQGGKFTKEECVVCLTDPKNVVLLPCRHLCVCSSCLTYVDKCPVCRALFEEYVIINFDNSISVTTP